MNTVKQNFNKSLKYSYQLYDTNPSFMNSIYFLLSRLNNNKNIRLTHKGKTGIPFCRYFTALTSRDSLRNKKVVDGKDYGYHNLTKTISVPMYRNLSKIPDRDFTRYFGIALYFNNKHSCKEFLKEIKIHNKDVIFGAYLAKTKQYEVVLRFIDGITGTQNAWLLNELSLILNSNKIRYKDANVTNYCYIPSTIYDRWFDPFTGKTQWNSKEIVKSFRNSVDYHIFARTLLNSTKMYKTYGEKYSDSRVNYFISNKNRLSTDMLKCDTYIVNHYLQQKNPYKVTSCRKDWKYAAEMYLNEVIGKFLYRKAKYIEEASKDVNTDNYGNDINEICKALDFRTDKKVIKKFHEAFFSKREAELFIKDLNLSTKINVLKLRKVVLDYLIQQGILEQSSDYKVKETCRSFGFCKDVANEFYKKILDSLKNSYNSLFFSFSVKKKIKYMLESELEKFCKEVNISKEISTNIGMISGPPDITILEMNI